MKCRICFPLLRAVDLCAVERRVQLLTFLDGVVVECMSFKIGEEIRRRREQWRGGTTRYEFPVIKHFVQSNAFIHCVSVSRCVVDCCRLLLLICF